MHSKSALTPLLRLTADFNMLSATTGVVALTASNLLLSPTVHLSSAFAALDAAAASVFPPCCSSLQLQQPPAAAAAVAAAAAATRALPGTAEWHQFVMSAAIAATANAAAASVQPQQRMLLDGEVFKRFCVGPAYALEVSCTPSQQTSLNKKAQP